MQDSGRSQSPAIARHRKVLGCFLSTQFALVPLQTSCASQVPAGDIPHIVPFARNESPGQTNALVQVSAMSQPPAIARQVVPTALVLCAGHVAAPPGHVSAGSQIPVEVRQTNIEG